ncbi:MAG: uncharacterized protein JWM74_1198 [Myxococcaceae bacterium]|nr:uncharacterized protein [Myxococcaceae bacterium]
MIGKIRKIALVASTTALVACSAILGLPDAVDDPGFVPPGADGSVADGTSSDGTSSDGNPTTDGNTEDGFTPPDGSACPGKNLLTDMANCGACGFDCTAGVSCSLGLCTMREGLKSPVSIRGNASGIYVAVYYADEIIKCAHNGCAAGVTVLATGTNSPFAIDVREADPHVYWVNDPQTNGTVSRVGTDGGTVEVLAPNEFFLQNIAVDATHFYFAGGGGLGRCPLAGCTGGVAELLADDSQGDPQGVALNDAGRVAWTTYSGNVRSCAKANCDASVATTSIATNQDTPGPIAIDDTNAYWSNYGTGSFSGYDPGSGSFKTCALGGTCGANANAFATGANKPSDIFIDGGELFWVSAGIWNEVDTGAPDGEVWRCQTSNCKATARKVAGNQRGPLAIWADKTAIYWTIRGLGGGIADGAILKAPR